MKNANLLILILSTLVVSCGTRNINKRTEDKVGSKSRDIKQFNLLDFDKNCTSFSEEEVLFGGISLKEITVEANLDSYKISTNHEKEERKASKAYCNDPAENTLDYIAKKTKQDLLPVQNVINEVLDETLPDVKLHIHPYISTIIDNQFNPILSFKHPELFEFSSLPIGKTYVNLSDNASWSYRVSNNQKKFTITVFPQSKKSAANNVKPLWESDLIVKHEYGHHLFSHIFLRPSDRELTTFDFKNKFEQYERNIESKRTINNTIDNQNIIGSINEGFSDLIGIYSGGKMGDVEGANCFEKNRSPIVSNFSNGVSKTLSDEMVIRIFFNPPLNDPNSEELFCLGFKPESLHHKGALYSHLFNKIVHNANIDNQQKIKILVDWIRVFSKKYDEILWGPLKTFDESLYSLVEAIEVNSVLESEVLCDLVEQVIPSKSGYLKNIESYLATCEVN